MTTDSKWDTYNFIDFLKIDSIEIKELPIGVSVSTMCASCKLNSRLDINNIEKYLQLNSDDVLMVKMNDEKIRTIINKKNKPKRTNKTKTNQKDTTKNHFYNQITVIIRIDQGTCRDLNEVPKINLKLFRNGSVQMSGCKSVRTINIVLNKLIVKLKEVKAKIDDGKINEIKFIDDPEKITITNFKIDMINSNYQVNMQIDRVKLQNLLNKKKIKSSYEPCIRACVIIKYTPDKYNPDQKEISLFVFQKGNIIITGARSKHHILSAYNYMNNLLLTHTNEIIKKDENKEEELIIDIYNDIIKNANLGI